MMAPSVHSCEPVQPYIFKLVYTSSNVKLVLYGVLRLYY